MAPGPCRLFCYQLFIVLGGGFLKPESWLLKFFSGYIITVRFLQRIRKLREISVGGFSSTLLMLQIFHGSHRSSLKQVWFRSDIMEEIIGHSITTISFKFPSYFKKGQLSDIATGPNAWKHNWVAYWYFSWIYALVKIYHINQSLLLNERFLPLPSKLFISNILQY